MLFLYTKPTTAMKKLLSLLLIFCCISSISMDAAHKKAKHVVLIGIDGWAAKAVREAPAEDYPNIHYLMDHGSWTLAKRSVMPSASAINWASMFNGAPTEMHGYTKWNSRRPEIPSMIENEHQKFPTIFSILREQYPNVVQGCIAEWDGIKQKLDAIPALKEGITEVYNSAKKDAGIFVNEAFGDVNDTLYTDHVNYAMDQYIHPALD